MPAFAALGASFAGIASANEVHPKHAEPVKPNEPPKKEVLNEAAKTSEQDSTAIEVLRWIDPNLSSLIINLTYCFTEPIIFHKNNLERLKKGIGGISEADLIHNNSDRWANAMASAMSYLLAYSARFPFTVWVANESSEGSEEVKKQNRVFSDFMTINTYYGQTFADRYLTNAFQHELRQAYKKVLMENPQYKYQPWAIPLSKTIQIFRDIYPPIKSSVKEDVKESAGALKRLGSINENLAVEWLRSRRNQLDLMLIFLSYVGTFTDIPSLITGNKLNANSANTATGRVIANLPCQAVLCKNLLKKLKEKGDMDGYNEEKVMSAAGLLNGPIYYAINSAIQSVTDSALGLKKYSDTDVAFSNLREIIGAINGSIIFMFLQYRLESTVRANIKDTKKGLAKEGMVSRFANWYIEPDVKGNKPDS